MAGPSTRRTRGRRTSDQVVENASIKPGIYLGRVVSHLDQKFMGSLKVQLLKVTEAGNDFQEANQLLTCHYASPFLGQTPLQNVGANNTYQETQQSYGFWAVPPDIGTKVIVLKVEGADDFGFWVGCVQDEFMNFMVPDGRPATVNNDQGQKLPVGEFNKAIVNPDGELQPTRYPKPVNEDFVEILAEQGLLEDDVRGLTTSSARREVPSAVFGISTPGPLDKRPGAPRNPRGPVGEEANVPSSRLGGTSIVMDDGDDKILRVGSPADTPMEYVDIENASGEADPTRPSNELFRIRTRTGHQILLHNTEDLIYIANSRGTTWIELTSNGKIDIYAEDSISVHSSQDLNFTADRDINLNATENININAGQKIKVTSGSSLDVTSVDYTAFTSGQSFTARADTFVAVDAQKALSLSSNQTLTATSKNSAVNIAAQTKLHLTGKAGIHQGSEGAIHIKDGTDTFIETNALHVNTQEFFAYAKGQMNLKSDADVFVNSKGVTNIKADAEMYIDATATLHVRGQANYISSTGGTIDINASTTLTAQSGALMSLNAGANIHASGSQIHLNSPGNTAGTATPAVPAIPAALATVAVLPNPATPETPITSLIAKIPARVPEHEPWLQHEHLDPISYTPDKTRAGQDSIDTFAQPIPDTFVNVGSRSTAGATTRGGRGGQTGGYNPPTYGEPEGGEETLGDFRELKRDQIYVVGDGIASGIKNAGGYQGQPTAGATVDQVLQNQVGRIPEDTIVLVAAGSANYESTPSEVAGKLQQIVDRLLQKNCYVINVVFPDIDLAGPYASTYSAAGYTSNYNDVRTAVAGVQANGKIELSSSDIDPNDATKTKATAAAYSRVVSVANTAIENIPVPESEFEQFSGTLGPLLAAIRKAELSTTSREGYDIIYGGISRTQYPQRPLTQMSVNEVLAWQATVTGSNSTASGAYQFIRPTLLDLKDRVRACSGGDTFDVALQDRLAIALMRNLDNWKEGKISDEEFGYGLSKVWASLPMMLDGATDSKGVARDRNSAYYGGVGDNKANALISADELKAALVASKRGETSGTDQETPARLSPEELNALGFTAADPYEDYNSRNAQPSYTAPNADLSNLGTQDRVTQAQAGTRRLPLQQSLVDVLNRAANAAGVYVKVTSGGQMPISEWESYPSSRRRIGYKNGKPKDYYLDNVKVRTGSTRHDTGLACDLQISREPNGSPINYNHGNRGRGADNELWDNFLYYAFKFGCRGFGFAQNYMGNRTMHLDTLGALSGSSYNSNTVGHWLTADYFVNIARRGLNDA